jgi:2-polyprenyl-6-methoxyphenol hydroxylase-like FAD-dependent oxidoreductase
MFAATIREPAREVVVRDRCDVAVVGGGIAGVAAAVAAARAGAEVWLLEKSWALGGLATLGNVVIFLPLCDGRGRQVIGGLAEELMHLGVADVPADDRRLHVCPVPACWQPDGDPAQRARVRYRADFNPTSLLLALEALVVASGVRLLYDTRVCAVARDGERVSHLLLENVDGRTALAVGAVVDASGEAEVCAQAGEPTASLDTNVLAGWFYLLRDGRPELVVLSKPYAEDGSRHHAEGPFFRGDDALQATAQVLGTRAWMRKHVAGLRRAQPETTFFPFQAPTVPGVRMTRRLRGRAELREADAGRWCADAVALTGDWRRSGPVYAVSLGCLAGVANENLLVAGRCLSAEGSAWDMARAIPTCAATGQAAGTAAALAVREGGGALPRLDVGRLQHRLRDDGVILEESLLSGPSADLNSPP